MLDIRLQKSGNVTFFLHCVLGVEYTYKVGTVGGMARMQKIELQSTRRSTTGQVQLVRINMLLEFCIISNGIIQKAQFQIN